MITRDFKKNTKTTHIIQNGILKHNIRKTPALKEVQVADQLIIPIIINHKID